MINIIREDLTFNSDLQSFPSANANVAIFGTQSSGKSTLLNHVFGTNFPILDTLITRERCTKGVWLHPINNFNVIDTEGFDSSQRQASEKIFEKQVAMFCLALSDVLIINMWMNQIGRYQASHSHILKVIIKASERLIAKQQRKIVFVVRDCTDDADRSILRDELNTQMQGVIKAETKKSNIKFTLDYVMMSHFYENEAEFQKEAKQLLRIVSSVRKSNLSNYTQEDRMVYVKDLWEKVTTNIEIDLRTVQEALRSYALQRIKRQTIQHMENWIVNVEYLTTHKTYGRYKEAALRQARQFFTNLKPRYLKEREIEPYLESIFQVLYPTQNKHFMAVLLPQEEDRLIQQEFNQKINQLMGANIAFFKQRMTGKRQDVQQAYQVIVKGLYEHAKMTRRFKEKLDAASNQYTQHLQHLQNLFRIELEAVLNAEMDKQTKYLSFDGKRIKKIIQITQQKHKSEIGNDLQEIWDRVVHRTTTGTVIQQIKTQSQQFTTAGVGLIMGDQNENIVNFYHRLQDKAEKYIDNVVNFTNEDESTQATLEKVQNIRKLINELLQEKIVEEAQRFKITMVFVAFMMFFFYSQFKFLLKMLGMRKRRMRNWIWLYFTTMITLFGILIYRKRQYFKKFITPDQ